MDVIQDVFVNNFNNFTGRKVSRSIISVILLIWPTILLWNYKYIQFFYNDKNAGLFQSSNNKWKRFRTIINPTFSPAKLKQVIYRIDIKNLYQYLLIQTYSFKLIPLLRKCSDRLINLIEKNPSKTINLQEYFDNMAMDVGK